MKTVLRALAAICMVLAVSLPFAGTALAQQAPSMQVTVNITDSGFSPQTIEVLPGGVVTWVNKGTKTHNAKAINGDPALFDVPGLDPGQNWGFQFLFSGSVSYTSAIDCLNGNMTPGFNCTPVTVVVTGTFVPVANPQYPQPGGTDARCATNFGDQATWRLSGDQGCKGSFGAPVMGRVNEGWYGQVDANAFPQYPKDPKSPGAADVPAGEVISTTSITLRLSNGQPVPLFIWPGQAQPAPAPPQAQPAPSGVLVPSGCPAALGSQKMGGNPNGWLFTGAFSSFVVPGDTIAVNTGTGNFGPGQTVPGQPGNFTIWCK